MLFVGTALLSVAQTTPIRTVARRSVLEDFTGTTCGWCTRGWVAMELLHEKYGDQAICISLHQYNQYDPMYCSNYAKVGFDSAPNAMLNRNGIFIDPYFGLGSTAMGVCELIDMINAEHATVDVSVAAEWTSEAQEELKCTATVEPLTEGEKYTIAFVVTADSLYSEDSEWAQTNYYASQPAEAYGYPDLTCLTPSGQYGKSQVFLVHSDVLVASSYIGPSNYGRFPNGTKFECGVPITSSYTIKLSSVNKAVQPLLHKDRLNVIALVYNSQKEIANAAICHTSDLAAPSAIAAPTTAVAAPQARFTLSGQPATGATRGLQLVRQADGRYRKVYNK